MAEVLLNIKIGSDGTATLTNMSGGMAALGTATEDVKAKLGSFGSVLEGIGQGIGNRVFDTLASAVQAVPAFFVEAARSVMEFGSHIAELAAKAHIGTTVLQELGHEGALVGVSMDDIGGAVGKMEKNLGEGSTAFARMGLNIGALRAMNPAEAFEAVSAQLLRVKDAAGIAAAGSEIFGKTWQTVFPLMKESSAALREEAERLGFVISEQMIAASAALNKQFITLGETWQGFIRNIGSAVTSSAAMQIAVAGVTDILGFLSVMVRNNQEYLRSLVDQGIELVLRGLEYLVLGIGLVLDGWSTLKINTIEVTARLMEVAAGAEAAAKALAHPLDAVQIWDQLQSKIKEISEATIQLVAQETRAQTERGVVIGTVAGKFQDLADKVHANIGQAVQLEGAHKTLAPAIDFTGKASEEAAKKAQTAADAYSKFSNEIVRQYQQVMAEGDKWSQQVTKINNDAAKSVEEEAIKFEAAHGLIAEASHKATLSEIEDIRQQRIAEVEHDKEFAEIHKAIITRQKAIDEQYQRSIEEVSKFSLVMDAAGKGMTALGVSSSSTLGILVEGLTRSSAAGADLGKGLAAVDKAAADHKSTLQGYTQVALGAVQALGEIGKAADSGKTALESMYAAAAAGASAGAAFGPKGAVAGAAFGTAFAIGASEHISTLAKVGAAAVSTVTAPVVVLGAVFHAVFGGGADEAARMNEVLKQQKADIDAAKAATEAHQQAIDATKAAMDKYGITVDEMGPKWQQQDLDGKAMDLLKDYSLLSAASDGHNEAMSKMGPAMSAYVQQAQAAGVSIPESMRPALQKMLDMGVLTDAAGNKLTSLDGINFEATLTQQVETLLAGIQKLVDALNHVPREVSTTVRTFFDSSGPPPVIPGHTATWDPNSGGFVEHASGTMSTTPHLAMIHGSPSNPEIVAPVKQFAREMGAAAAEAAGGGGMGGTPLFVVSEASNTLRQATPTELEKWQKAFDDGLIQVPKRQVVARRR